MAKMKDIDLELQQIYKNVTGGARIKRMAAINYLMHNGFSYQQACEQLDAFIENQKSKSYAHPAKTAAKFDPYANVVDA